MSSSMAWLGCMFVSFPADSANSNFKFSRGDRYRASDLSVYNGQQVEHGAVIVAMHLGISDIFSELMIRLSGGRRQEMPQVIA